MNNRFIGFLAYIPNMGRAIAAKHNVPLCCLAKFIICVVNFAGMSIGALAHACTGELVDAPKRLSMSAQKIDLCVDT